jgi:hypothetical protein
MRVTATARRFDGLLVLRRQLKGAVFNFKCRPPTGRARPEAASTATLPLAIWLFSRQWGQRDVLLFQPARFGELIEGDDDHQNQTDDDLLDI